MHSSTRRFGCLVVPSFDLLAQANTNPTFRFSLLHRWFPAGIVNNDAGVPQEI